MMNKRYIIKYQNGQYTGEIEIVADENDDIEARLIRELREFLIVGSFNWKIIKEEEDDE